MWKNNLLSDTLVFWVHNFSACAWKGFLCDSNMCCLLKTLLLFRELTWRSRALRCKPGESSFSWGRRCESSRGGAQEDRAVQAIGASLSTLHSMPCSAVALVPKRQLYGDASVGAWALCSGKLWWPCCHPDPLFVFSVVHFTASWEASQLGLVLSHFQVYLFFCRAP